VLREVEEVVLLLGVVEVEEWPPEHEVAVVAVRRERN
jgi:hypothetical protein